MPQVKKSLPQKIGSIYLMIFVAVFLVLGLLTSHLTGRRVMRFQENTLLAESRLAAETLAPLIQDKNTGTLQSVANQTANSLNLHVTIVDASGKIITDSQNESANAAAQRTEIVRALQTREGLFLWGHSHDLNTKVLYAVSPVIHKNELLGAVRLGASDSQLRRLRDSIKSPLHQGIIAGIVLVALICSFLTYYITRRFRMMTNAALRYAKGHLTPGLPIDADDEMGVLADSLNTVVRSLKHHLAETEQEKAKVAAVLNNMTEGVIGVDHRKMIFVINTSAQKILNIPATQVTGKSFIQIVRNPEIDEIMSRAIDEGTCITADVELFSPSKKSLHISAVGISKEENALCGILVFFDVSEMKQLERLRKEFVANVSHELKTPLTSLKGFIETLLEGASKDTAQTEHFLKIMREDTERLTRLIDDLLQLSKIESGETPLKKEKFLLQEEVKKAIESLAPRLSPKKITVDNKLAKDLPAVSAEKDKIKQVLLNLFENAVKFNRIGGSIQVTAHTEKQMVVCSIEDNGIGIPEKSVSRVFERFYRVDEARTREAGGTGLGLSIVKHIIERHGGKVSCESRLGHGSKFTFFLPLA